MKNFAGSFGAILLIFPLLVGFIIIDSFAAALIIDHTCTDLSEVPPAWIDSVKATCRLHYAHTSHGSQLMVGLDTLERTDPFYDHASGYCSLPLIPGTFCIHDGQVSDDYISPDKYWETAYGMNLTRTVLAGNPYINFSMWAWCSQLNNYSADQVQAYLDSMAQLESEFPEVTFIYMTGNAQGLGWEGYNRWLRNNQIRDYCLSNDKVLFDFADMDAWSGSEQHTYVYETFMVPAEHPDYYGDDEWSHTAYANCLNKGKALWYGMARLAGWEGGTGVREEETSTPHIPNLKVFPNPSNGVAKIYIDFGNPTTPGLYASCCEVLPSVLEIQIYDLNGRLISAFSPAVLPLTSVEWIPDNRIGSGVYLITARSTGKCFSTRIMYLK